MWWGKRGNPEATEDREWADAIAGCLALKPNYYPAIHPDKHIPSARLALLQDLVVPGPDARDHPAVIVLSTLVEGGEAYEAEVPVRLIRGVAQSKGKIVFDLGRLPETMDLLDKSRTGPESFGPLNRRQYARLCGAIKRESGAIDESGRVKLDFQTWDGCYIVRNSGAARRLALWCRLQNYYPKDINAPGPKLTVQAWVTPKALNEANMFFFREHSRILFLMHDPALEAAIAQLRSLDPNYLYLPPAVPPRADDADRPAAIVLPMLHRVAPSRVGQSVLLQHWAAELFDVGRYLAERCATYNSENSRLFFPDRD